MLGSVVTNRRKGRGLEAHGERGGRLFDESGGRGVPMSSPSSARGLVLGYDLIDSSGRVDEEIIFEIAGRAGEVSMVFLGKVCDFVD